MQHPATNLLFLSRFHQFIAVWARRRLQPAIGPSEDLIINPLTDWMPARVAVYAVEGVLAQSALSSSSNFSPTRYLAM